MAASSAKKGFGYKLQVESATPDTFNDVSELLTVSTVGGTRELADVTHFESDGSFHEYIGTLRDSMEIQVECNYVPSSTGQDRIKTIFDSGAVNDFKLVGPAGTINETIAFAGIVTSHGINTDKAAQVKLQFNIKITGDQTTSATSP